MKVLLVRSALVQATLAAGGAALLGLPLPQALALLGGLLLLALLIGQGLVSAIEEKSEIALDSTRAELKKKSEDLAREREELGALMGALSEAILAVDTEGRPLFCNSQFGLLFLGEEARASRPKLGEIFRDPAILDSFARVLKSGQQSSAETSLFVKTDTRPRSFQVLAAPLKRESGEVYGAVGIFHDVTQLKLAEKIRIDFVANVSHELRTPLTSIKGYVDTLKLDLEAGRLDSAPQFLEVISRNSDRLMRLIEDLLQLSALESAGESTEESTGLSRQPLKVTEVTERVLQQLEGRRAEKDQRFETRFLAETVFADPARLEQVLVNLLENAIKYTPKGGLIRVGWYHEPGGSLLQVSDNGPGIAPEHLPRLFERFYRVDQARSREVGGTGLGLAIVKHIMKLHGGAVWVTSEPGQGSTFFCRFPES